VLCALVLARDATKGTQGPVVFAILRPWMKIYALSTTSNIFRENSSLSKKVSFFEVKIPYLVAFVKVCDQVRNQRKGATGQLLPPAKICLRLLVTPKKR